MKYVVFFFVSKKVSIYFVNIFERFERFLFTYFFCGIFTKLQKLNYTQLRIGLYILFASKIETKFVGSKKKKKKNLRSIWNILFFFINPRCYLWSTRLNRAFDSYTLIIHSHTCIHFFLRQTLIKLLGFFFFFFSFLSVHPSKILFIHASRTSLGERGHWPTLNIIYTRHTQKLSTDGVKGIKKMHFSIY